MTRGPQIAVTPGDPDGIGPEVVWKTLRKPRWKQLLGRIVCVGSADGLQRVGARLERYDSMDVALAARGVSARLRLVVAPCETATVSRSSLSRDRDRLAGFQSGWSIREAARAVLHGKASAIVTGPINKARLQAGGFQYAGHTDFLADLCGVRNVTMMLANDRLRVALVTTHLALSRVPRALTKDSIIRCMGHVIAFLSGVVRIQKPKIAVLGLNPHAGERGLFGNEEVVTILPAIRSCKREWGRRAVISGPYSADTFFALHALASKPARHDAVICMYHDQALIPVKLLDFARTINVTLGLPIIRTSVDHGTAFDIAGKGLADPSSFEAALSSAFEMVGNR